MSRVQSGCLAAMAANASRSRSKPFWGSNRPAAISLCAPGSPGPSGTSGTAFGIATHRRAARSEQILPGRPVGFRERHQHGHVGKSGGQGVTGLLTVVGQPLVLLRDDNDSRRGQPAGEQGERRSCRHDDGPCRQRSQPPNAAGRRSRATHACGSGRARATTATAPGTAAPLPDSADSDACSSGRQVGEAAAPRGRPSAARSAPRRTLTTSTSWFAARWSAVVKVARMTPPTPDALMIRKRTRRRRSAGCAELDRGFDVDRGLRPP